MLISLIVFLCGTSIFVFRNKQDIRAKNFKKKYGELTEGLNFRYKDAKLSPVIFLLRRLVFAAIVVYLISFNYFQI